MGKYKMNNRRIYEISYNELKEIYRIYKDRIRHNNNDKFEESDNDFNWSAEELPFLNSKENEYLLKHYIEEIGKNIKSNFVENYIRKKQILKLCYINQPFERKNFDIFISHSHKDVKMVMELAEKIHKETNSFCFVDSKYWPYFNDVIEDCIQIMYKNDERGKLSLCDISKTVRDIIDIYLLEALQIQLLYSEIIIIVKTENYSLNSHWIRYENNVIDYIRDKESCSIQHINVRDLLKLIYKRIWKRKTN
jgi:hypothetical protein